MGERRPSPGTIFRDPAMLCARLAGIDSVGSGRLHSAMSSLDNVWGAYGPCRAGLSEDVRCGVRYYSFRFVRV